MSIRYPFGTALLSAALLTASTGSAATFDLEFQAPQSTLPDAITDAFSDANGENAWGVETDYTEGSETILNAAVGAYRVKAELYGAAADFLAFCLEPLKDFDLPAPYERLGAVDLVAKFGEGVIENLNILAENAMNEVTDSKTAAAFQMAAWELTTETDSVFDIDAGHFQVAGGTTKADLALGVAQDWLDNIQNDRWTAPTSSFMILSSDTNQDLLTSVEISAVPLPATGWMMVTALAGAGALSARRRRAARRS